MENWTLAVEQGGYWGRCHGKGCFLILLESGYKCLNSKWQGKTPVWCPQWTPSKNSLNHLDLRKTYIWLNIFNALTSHNFQRIQADLRSCVVSCSLHCCIQHSIQNRHFGVIENQSCIKKYKKWIQNFWFKLLYLYLATDNWREDTSIKNKRKNPTSATAD